MLLYFGEIIVRKLLYQHRKQSRETFRRKFPRTLPGNTPQSLSMPTKVLSTSTERCSMPLG